MHVGIFGAFLRATVRSLAVVCLRAQGVGVAVILDRNLELGVREVDARDEGPGIPNLEVILSGAYKSRTGLGRGIIGTRSLLDEMKIESAVGKGTRITGFRRARKP